MGFLQGRFQAESLCFLLMGSDGMRLRPSLWRALSSGTGCLWWKQTFLPRAQGLECVRLALTCTCDLVIPGGGVTQLQEKDRNAAHRLWDQARPPSLSYPPPAPPWSPATLSFLPHSCHTSSGLRVFILLFPLPVSSPKQVPSGLSGSHCGLQAGSAPAFCL